MRREGAIDIVVVEPFEGGRRPLGVVTDRALVTEVLARGLDPAEVTVGDLMLGPVNAVDSRQSYRDAILGMARMGLARLLVVNGEGGLIGIVRLDEILQRLVAATAAVDVRHDGEAAKRA
jgi:signal-transduction protein with cAMP-binding, CBS, and nucleotidyltransferase domain